MVAQGHGGAIVSIASAAAFVGLPGRLAATKEIASVVRYLVGDEATYVTGQTIVADGGWTVQGIPNSPSWLQTPGSQ